MIPARAYASTAIGGQYGSAVECAVETLGVSWGSLTADQQSYLFNATTSTENMDQFAVFRNSLHEFTPSSGLGGNAYYSTLEGSMYAVVATNARRQLAAYLQGASSGGGGGSSGSEITNPLVLDGVFGYYPQGYKSTDSVIGKTVTITFDSFAWNQINEQVAQGYQLRFYYKSSYSSTGLVVVRYNDETVLSEQYSDNAAASSNQVSYQVTVSGQAVSSCSVTDVIASSGNITMNCNGIGYFNSGAYFAGNYYRYMYSNTASGGGGSGGGSGGGDEPVTPPVEQPTNPTGPTITGPTININTGGNNSSTTTADLTPILEMLRIINDNIGIVNGNITSFSDWFGDSWGDYVDWLQLWFERFGLSLDNIYAQQELVGSNIVDELREIEDVLWYIFYKPDPEYPTSTPYDDTELQGILNGMWADNNGYLNSIQNLLMQISGQIDGLDDVYTPHVGTGKTTQEQLDEDVARLKRKFPFSIPWDLYALLQFLQAPPSAPTFSFTLPYMGTLQCDLSVFDDVAAVCRWVSLLWFVAGLLASTNKLLNLMNVYERND